LCSSILGAGILGEESEVGLTLSIVACFYLLLLVSFVDSATRLDGAKPILKATVRLLLEFVLAFFAIAAVFYLLNIKLYY
jgi:hypothetical protein